MIKQLLNSAIAKYRNLSVARRSIICLCLRHRQIIDLLATDKSRYFAQPRPIIVYCFTSHVYYFRLEIYNKTIIGFTLWFFPLEMFNITIIGFSFCDMQNYQCLDQR